MTVIITSDMSDEEATKALAQEIGRVMDELDAANAREAARREAKRISQAKWRAKKKAAAE